MKRCLLFYILFVLLVLNINAGGVPKYPVNAFIYPLWPTEESFSLEYAVDSASMGLIVDAITEMLTNQGVTWLSVAGVRVTSPETTCLFFRVDRNTGISSRECVVLGPQPRGEMIVYQFSNSELPVPGELYRVVAEGGDFFVNYFLPSDKLNTCAASMTQYLAGQGCTWLNVVGAWVTSRQSVMVQFQASANTSRDERCCQILDVDGNPVTVCQATPYVEPEVFALWCDERYTVPGMRLHVTLNGSETGVTYHFYNSGELVGSLPGTGQALHFNISEPGVYTATAERHGLTVDMIGRRQVEWLPLIANGLYDPTPLSYRMNNNGGSVQVKLTHRADYNNLRYELEWLVAKLNNGEIQDWNSGFKITNAQVYTGYSHLTIEHGPNFYTSVTRDKFCVNVTTNSWFNIEQRANGGLLSYDVTGTSRIPLDGSGTITLSGRQPLVEYTLYRDGNPCPGTMNSSNTFTGIRQYGTYRVKATYNSHEGWMNGEVEVVPDIRVYTVEGGGTIYNNNPVDIRIKGSQVGVTYRLECNGTAVDEKSGTGSSLVFSVMGVGTYTIRAVVPGYNVMMTGGVEVTRSEEVALTGTRNYVSERVYLDTAASRSVQNVTYLDDMGRKLQEVAVHASPDGVSDIITPYVYGPFGSEVVQFLPYPRSGNHGGYHGGFQDTVNWSVYGAGEAAHARSFTRREGGPKNRVLEFMGAGAAWQRGKKKVVHDHGTNAANEVRRFRVEPSGELVADGYYPASTLRKTTVSDEDGNRVETFTGGGDRVLLQVCFDGTTRHETCNVYDLRGQLRYVLSPEASARLEIVMSDTVLRQFAYRYDYDRKGRVVVKSLPGCDPVYLVYDKRDRLVMSQDGKQRAENAKKWSYSLYDGKNRVVETGEVILNTMISHDSLRVAASSSLDYTPAGTRVALQYTLYDNYTSTSNVPVKAFVATPGYATRYHSLVTGLATSVKTRVLGTDTWLTTTTYYDDCCRVIQTVSDNLQGGLSRVDMKYDFTGNVVKQRESHASGGRTDVLESENVYDDRGRLLSTTVKLNNGSSATTSYTYDAIGRLVKKKHGTVEETLAYNSRGWLTGKESVPFKMKLRYENPVGDADTCWNGNISEWEWQQGTSATLMYCFAYDGLNRLTGTTQQQKNGMTWSTLAGSYLEKGIIYDRNGNIKTLQRTASGTLVDNLVYSYTGNQLTGLTESVRTALTGDIYLPGSATAGSYVYDQNGNMTNDSRRALNFGYNVLNLLCEVKTAGGELKASYSYLADGTKLRVRDAGGNGFDYLGSLTYKSGNAGLQLESANFGGGVILASTSGQEVNYFLTDHLGSVRAIVDSSGVVKERNDYYPFGARHARADYPQLAANRFKYNGKEEQVAGDLGYLDYGWRMLDKGLGRWFGRDKLSEMMPSLSGYVYGLNNPVRVIDLFGLYPGKKDDPAYSILLPEVVVSRKKTYVPSTGLYWYYPGTRDNWDNLLDWDELERRGRAYSESQGMGRMSRENLISWENSFQITMNYGVPLFGNYFSVRSGLRYTPDISFGKMRIDGYWQSAKGTYYSLRVLEKRANGKYVPGVNGLRISQTWAKSTASISNTIGKVTGWASVIYSGTRFFSTPNWEDGLDSAIGVVGIYYWPVGVSYFGSKLFYAGMLNYTQVMMNNGLVPGWDDRNIWK